MKNILDLMQHTLNNGQWKNGRNGRTISTFGHQMRFDLANDYFPLVTTRKIFVRGVFEELLWFLRGSVNVEELTEKRVHIWDAWQGQNKTIGPMYGEQWRNWNSGVNPATLLQAIESRFGNEPISQGWIRQYLEDMSKPYFQGGRGGVDQIEELMTTLRKSPDSRRMVVNVWNPTFMPDESISPSENVDDGNMSLPPCHPLWQVYTHVMSVPELVEVDINDGVMGMNRFKSTENEKKEYSDYILNETVQRGYDEYMTFRSEMGYKTRKLSLQLYARSQDIPVGTVFNIVAYALLTKMIAQCVNMAPGEYIHTCGDAHIYENQIPAVEEQLARTPVESIPKLILTPGITDLERFTIEDFHLFDYSPLDAISMPVSV